MDIEIREVETDRLDELWRVLSFSFGREVRSWEVEWERPVFADARTLGGFEGGQLVGVAASLPREISVPGGSHQVSAITGVGVLPTHRRRGILAALMRRQLDELREAGQALAALWASEGAIYQRFGYGLGTLAAHFEIERRHSAFTSPVEMPGGVRLLDRDEAHEAFPPIYDRVRTDRPGMLDRPGEWWRYLLADPEQHREGFSAYFHALYEGPGGAEGYATYRIKPGWSAQGADHTLEIEELMAATPQAYAALWRYCLDIDLVGRIEGWKRPVDEALPFMLAEPRRLKFLVRDGLWVRLVDVPAALEARRYAAAGRVVLEVRDPFCPWNEGVFLLEGSPDGAACRTSNDEPELVLGATDLGAAYLGGISLATLVRAGRVLEAVPGAAVRADAMLRWDPAPWSPHLF